MKVVTNTGEVEDHLVIHSKEASGTIISVEHHCNTNPDSNLWTQKSIPTENRGWITFYRADNTIVSQYDTTRIDGLYYMDLTIIRPPPVAHRINTTQVSSDSLGTSTTSKPTIVVETITEAEALEQNVTIITDAEEQIGIRTEDQVPLPTNTDTGSGQQTPESDHHGCHKSRPSPPPRPKSPTSTFEVDEIDDLDLDMETEYIPHIIHHAAPAILNPLNTEIKKTTLTWATRQERDLLNFEIWHQQMGHVTEDKLRKT